MANGPPESGSPTLREVYALVDGTRRELLAELSALATKVETRQQIHDTEHKDHESRHEREALEARKARSGLIRWAVTSLLSGVGVLVALYVAFRYGA